MSRTFRINLLASVLPVISNMTNTCNYGQRQIEAHEQTYNRQTLLQHFINYYNQGKLFENELEFGKGTR